MATPLNNYEAKTTEQRRAAIKKWVQSFNLPTKTIAEVLQYPSKRTVDDWRVGRRAPMPILIPTLLKAEPKLLKLAEKNARRNTKPTRSNRTAKAAIKR